MKIPQNARQKTWLRWCAWESLACSRQKLVTHVGEQEHASGPDLAKTRRLITQKIHTGFSPRSNDSPVLEVLALAERSSERYFGKAARETYDYFSYNFSPAAAERSRTSTRVSRGWLSTLLFAYRWSRPFSTETKLMEHRRVNRISRDYANPPKFRDGEATAGIPIVKMCQIASLWCENRERASPRSCDLINNCCLIRYSRLSATSCCTCCYVPFCEVRWTVSSDAKGSRCHPDDDPFCDTCGLCLFFSLFPFSFIFTDCAINQASANSLRSLLLNGL